MLRLFKRDFANKLRMEYQIISFSFPTKLRDTGIV